MRRLDIRYGDLEHFRREFHRNIANGGVFIPCADALGLRERIEVRLLLDFCDMELTVPAEVVSFGRPGAGEADTAMGVAVQFLEPAGELRDRLVLAIDQLMPGALPRIWQARRTPVSRYERYDVRMRAVLSSPNGIQEVVTRDLSRSGVLISIDQDPVQIGEAVNLTLAHPRTGEELTLHAHVVRHEKLGGQVVALALHFDVRPERLSYTLRFLEEIRAHARARRRNAVQGPIQTLGLASLLQMFSSAVSAGTLLVRHGKGESRVSFANGSLCSARFGMARGTKALARMLGLESGEFEFYAELEEEFGEESTSMYGAVLEAMQQVDELGRLELENVPLSARVTAVGAAVPPEDKLAAEILAELERPMSVRTLLDRLPHFDAEIYRALIELREQGQIEIR